MSENLWVSSVFIRFEVVLKICESPWNGNNTEYFMYLTQTTYEKS